IFWYSTIISSSNTFTNNTISATSGNLVEINAQSGNNTFCLNNFTNTSSYYVTDTNGSNYYNTTVSGHAEGNIYANVLNGSVQVTGIANSSISGLYIGTSGTGYPYSNSTSGGKFICNFAGCSLAACAAILPRQTTCAM
ncbi:MAG: hypothetical protein NTX79_02585, partial [Candidatus Micrarchaeota archaeon]|nr:hypothetical protein [Candidatus Micrarchaeota archaeon]